MGFWLRMIRKSRWNRSEKPAWVPTGQIPADPLADWNTTEHGLSRWKVESDQSNLIRIVTALAFERDKPANFDYILTPCEEFENVDINIVHAKGGTRDAHANEQWHYDALDLTCEKVVVLARKCWNANLDAMRITRATVVANVRSALANNQLDRTGREAFIADI